MTISEYEHPFLVCVVSQVQWKRTIPRQGTLSRPWNKTGLNPSLSPHKISNTRGRRVKWTLRSSPTSHHQHFKHLFHPPDPCLCSQCLAGALHKASPRYHTQHFWWSPTLYKSHEWIQLPPFQRSDFLIFSSKWFYKEHLLANSFIHTSLFRINSPFKVFPLSQSPAERLCHFTPSQLIYDKPHIPTTRQSYCSSSALPIRPQKSHFIILHHVSFTMLEAVDLKST